MKTKKYVERRVARDPSNIASSSLRFPGSLVPRPSKFGNDLAFTLVELLVVIAIIAVIAAFLFPLAGVLKQKAYIHNAQAQMAQLETAITQYKAAYGFYPPNSPYGPVTNQLYYELAGTTNIMPNGAPKYEVLGDPSQQLAANQVNTAFGVSGFMNCNKPGGDESSARAQDFLPDLTTNQVAPVTLAGVTATVLVTPLGGPDSGYDPLGTVNDGVNPWRYRAPGLNNPNSYDLWIQLAIGGKTNLICNWTSQVQINNHSVP